MDKIKDALDHFEDALAASIELDNKLLAAANSISTEYAGLISLVTRQAMGAIEYTILKNNQKIFLFEMNSWKQIIQQRK